MAYKVLIFGTDSMYKKLKPLYDAKFQKNNLEIVEVINDPKGIIDKINFDLAIISSKGDLYSRMKHLESMGVPRDKILDGRIFMIPNLDFPRFLKEGIAYGVFENRTAFQDKTSLIYPRVYKFKDADVMLNLGIKTRISSRKNFLARIETNGMNKNNIITFGSWCSVSWGCLFQIGVNGSHNLNAFTTYGHTKFDWKVPTKFRPLLGQCKILVGNDVWIGRGCTLKCSDTTKPLVIGDGAVIAADSVVVKSVPPYAIVGGNPAKIIRYRFEPHIIEALLRIKWWDWSLDKVHDNFKYFTDLEKFISLHDK